jgi:hypothetical protein
MTSIGNGILVVGSEWLLTPANVRLYHDKNWLHFKETIIISVWTMPTLLVDFFHSASMLYGKHLQTTPFHHEGGGLTPMKKTILTPPCLLKWLLIQKFEWSYILRVKGIDFASLKDFAIWFLNCSDSVIFLFLFLFFNKLRWLFLWFYEISLK